MNTSYPGPGSRHRHRLGAAVCDGAARDQWHAALPAPASRAAACGSCGSAAGWRAQTAVGRGRRVLRGSPAPRRGRCRARLRWADGDPDGLVRARADSIPRRAGRLDQAARHRQGQRRQGRGHCCSAGSRLCARRRQRGRCAGAAQGLGDAPIRRFDMTTNTLLSLFSWCQALPSGLPPPVVDGGAGCTRFSRGGTGFLDLDRRSHPGIRLRGG